VFYAGEGPAKAKAEEEKKREEQRRRGASPQR
jgi:hypothetical protein